MKSDRLLGIVLTLATKNRITAKELADYYDVNIRTIQRDIDAISASGIPVFSERGKDGGYFIDKNYKIDKSFFTDEEADLIMKLLSGVSSGLDSVKLKNTISKISTVKKDSCFQNDKIEFDFSQWGFSKKLKDRISTISDCIDQSNKIAIVYNSSDFDKTERIIEPHKLVNKSGVWYLYAYCSLRSDFRLFRINRIAEIKVLKERFCRREFSKLDFDKEWSEKNSEEFTLSFRGDGIKKAKLYFDDSEFEQANDNTVILRIRLPLNRWIYDFFLGFGDSLTLLNPDYAREKMKDILKNTLSNYDL
ncbi:MAG: YafY family transcriptional regulator [Candidatus Delongbacteria bacterium]|nr:YafY family transcriptional regulator [Candidatus Delongbacteria bacterium]MBN2835831.1 YafY family transcriptional regulator [Candidatus Delongbacteria bacterium]